MPAPIATGARRFSCTAPPSTSGSRGNTHGFNVVRLPATHASPSSAADTMSRRAPVDQRAFASAWRSGSGRLSPPRRATSVAPLNTSSTDCERTLWARLSSASVS